MVDQRQQDIVSAFIQHNSISQVIDVLRCAGKMDELGDLLKLRLAANRFLEKILHGLYIMIGSGFDRLDLFCVGYGEVSNNMIEECAGIISKRGYLLDLRCTGKLFKPAHFNFNTLFDQSEFAEQIVEGSQTAGVAAIKGRQGLQGRDRLW